MLPVIEALHARLAADPAVLAFVAGATFRDKPKLFADEPPGGAHPPYAIVGPVVADVPSDTLDGHGRELTVDLRLFAPVTGDIAPLAALAEHVRGLFHDRPLAVAGADVLLIRATGPVDASDTTPTTAVYGRVVTLRVLLETP